MVKLKRWWNGRAAGIPCAALLFLKVLFDRTADFLITLLWSGNLKEVGRSCRIQRGVAIRCPGQIKMGNCVTVGRGTSITSEFSDSTCSIGNRVQLNSNVHLDFTGCIEIGDGCVISEGVFVVTHSHGYDPHSTAKRMPLEIQKNVWIGAHAIICENVECIGDGAVIAAGSVVTRNVDPRCLYAGVPAKKIKPIDSALHGSFK